MLRPRIIPFLMIHKGSLVKTEAFKSPKYVGDPINAVKIFNEKEADELMLVDIDATVNRVEPNYSLIAKLAAECRMPLCYGGGINSVEQASRIISLGVEKIAIGAAAVADPTIVSHIAKAVGSQSVVVVLDVRKKSGLLAKGYELCSHNAKTIHKLDPVAFAQAMQEAGSGEIVINSVDRDGSMKGYDLVLAQQMHEVLRVPITMLGGAGSLEDLVALIGQCGLIGVAAGSLFLFKGKYRAVLINYPTAAQKEEICRAAWSLRNY
jgi:cyclase